MSSPAPMSEPGLLNGRPGSTPAGFGDWVRPHWPVLAALARRLSASDWEDVLQEALCSAWRKRGQFDPERGSARSWLLAITADQARKSHRRLRPVSELIGNEHAAVPDRSSAIDLERAIGGLTARQQLAVNLHYFLGLPLAEIAGVLGCSEGTAKSTLSDARRRIRASLGEDYR
jgi:RNA polymerase sigma-70 factor (ECF subfamily)